MKRALLYVLILIFLAGTGCYQKKTKVVKAPLAPRSYYHWAVPVIVDYCDLAKQNRRFAGQKYFKIETRLYCADEIRGLEEPLKMGKIRSNKLGKLKKLVKQYKDQDFKKID